MAISSSAFAQAVLFARPGAAPQPTDVRALGDTDGDGHADFGVWRGSLDSPDGSVRVYSGDDGSVRYTILGSESMPIGPCRRVGDVDADGYDDLLIGASGANGGFGSAYVFSGVDGSEIHRIDGPLEPSDWNFGSGVAPVGDLNADGYDDFLAIARRPLEGFNRHIVFSGADASVLRTWNLHPWTSSSAAGDVDADGYGDVVVYDAQPTEVVRVFSGQTGQEILNIPESAYSPMPNGNGAGFVRAAGDVDRDGHDDLILGMHRLVGDGVVVVFSGATGAVMYTLIGSTIPEVGTSTVFGAGFGFVSSAGDVNGDGFGDFSVGAPDTDVGGLSQAGAVHVFSGADASLIHSFYGGLQNERLGYNVSGARGYDIDDDGFDDVVAGTRASIAYAFDLGATGNPGRLRTHGAGCQGSNGRVPTIDSRGLAQIGEQFRVSLRGALDNGLALLYVGVPSELPLDSVGMIGCTLYQSPFMSVSATTDAHGMAGFDVAVSPNPSSVGLTVEMQWVSWDAAITPIGARLSEGLTVVVGS